MSSFYSTWLSRLEEMLMKEEHLLVFKKRRVKSKDIKIERQPNTQEEEWLKDRRSSQKEWRLHRHQKRTDIVKTTSGLLNHSEECLSKEDSCDRRSKTHASSPTSIQLGMHFLDSLSHALQTWCSNKRQDKSSITLRLKMTDGSKDQFRIQSLRTLRNYRNLRSW